MTHYPKNIKESGPLKLFSGFKFEASHQQHKCYARNINSRVNICLTLGMKASLKCSQQILNNEINEIICSLNPKIGQPLNYSNNYDLIKTLKETPLNTPTYNSLKFCGTVYKVGYYMTISSSDEIKLFKILDILVSNNDVEFLVEEYKIEKYNNHLVCYEIGEASNNYKIFNIKVFDGPPIHIYYIFNGSRVIKLKKYF